MWLRADGRELSTLDLFGDRLMVLTGRDGSAWRDAARRVARSLGCSLGAAAIGGAELADVSGDWLTRYGIDGDGAVLVRPDGHIAWRSASMAADPVATLEQVVRRALGFGAEMSTDADANRRVA